MQVVHSSVKEKVIYLLALPVFVQGNKTTVCIRIIISVCCSVLYVYIVQKKILFLIHRFSVADVVIAVISSSH